MKKKTKSKAKTDNNEQPVLYCSFCGKSQHEVKKLIIGPTVFICNECLILCLEIASSDEPKPTASKGMIEKKLNTFTGILFNKYEPVIDELIEKGNYSNVDSIIRDFLIYVVERHNRMFGQGNEITINAKLLEFPPSE